MKKSMQLSLHLKVGKVFDAIICYDIEYYYAHAQYKNVFDPLSVHLLL